MPAELRRLRRFLLALERWPFSGIPDNPGAWLMTTAKNRALDHLRRERREREKRPLLAASESAAEDPIEELDCDEQALPDDPLRLVFTCCHPALPREAQVALTQRLLCGLSTREIAAAFLVSESAAAPFAHYRLFEDGSFRQEVRRTSTERALAHSTRCRGFFGGAYRSFALGPLTAQSFVAG